MECVHLARCQSHIAGLVIDQRVCDGDIIASKVDLELVAKTARHLARYTQTGTACFAAKTFGASGRIRHIHCACIILEAAARLKRPAIIALDFRRAFEGDLCRRPGLLRGLLSCCRSLLGRCGLLGRSLCLALDLFQLLFESIHPRSHRIHLGTHGLHFSAQSLAVLCSRWRAQSQSAYTEYQSSFSKHSQHL